MTSIPSSTPTLERSGPERRDVGLALRRGFLGRCPRCGNGHVFRAFLKVRDRCEVCRENMHHHRADDAPPYLTVLIVAHVMGLALVIVLGTWDDMPTWVDFTLWPTMVVVLSLVLLPRIKGALVALQWALRMHGFGGGDATA